MDEQIHDEETSQGELNTSELTFTWIDPAPIGAGEQIVPAALSSADAHSFAALHLIAGDLQFALDCFKLANTFGTPDDRNLQSKALIFSGVVAYARCFKSGVRQSLSASNIGANTGTFDFEIHNYLVTLRDKHVAHSVNDFEDCQPVAIVVGRPESGWRDGSGVGVVIKQTVGISADLLRRAIVHIDNLHQWVTRDLETKRIAIYQTFRDDFKNTGRWEMAPLVKLSDRAKISRRRK